MKKFLSKFGNSKMWCGLLMVLSLGLLILLVMENNNTPSIPNESEKVKADYREKVRFSRDTRIEFSDFDLIYLGTGVSTGGGGACTDQIVLFQNCERQGKVEKEQLNWVKTNSAYPEQSSCGAGVRWQYALCVSR